jgi:subtilisin-like proprotein convertase family protein
MSPHVLSAMPLRSALLRLSPFVLAMGALLLPAQARAACSTAGNVTTCTSSGGITVSSTVGQSQGSSTAVSGLSGTITAISLTMTNLNVTDLNSVAMVLVPPSGSGLTPLDFFSGICGFGTQQVGNSTFNLVNSGATGTDNYNGMIPFLGGTCPGTLSGSYLPADYFPGQDVFNSPGPGTSYNSAGIGGTICSQPTIKCGSFNFSSFGTNSSVMNGTWTLYIANQAGSPSGSLGSWSLSFTGSSSTATTTSISQPIPNGSTSLVYTSSNVNNQATTPTSVTLSATVSPNPGGGTVTFYDSTGVAPGTGTVLASGVALNGSGVAQANSVTFPGTEEGSRAISAVFSPPSGFLGSTSSTATVLTTNHPYNPSTGTFCNGPITVNDDTGGSPYPSLLTLGTGNSQLQGTIESITVSLNNISLLNGVNLDNLGFLLQAPGSNTSGLGSSGNAFQFLSWAGNPFSSGSLTMSDAGTSEIPPFAAPACTTCLPTDNFIDIGSSNPDTFPSPAPVTFSTAAPTGSATFTTEFGGQGANNTWSLYLDNRIVQTGTLGEIGSWCMNFTMQANAHPTATSVSGSPNPAQFTPPATKASVTLTATVSVTDSSGLTVNAGTVTFVDGSTNLGSGTVTNGVATLNTTLTEGTHQIVATYSGTNTGSEFGISTGKYNQRVDTATTKPASGSGAGPYTYCNTGPVTTPGLGADAGAAAPYPSNIFVTNLPGTVDAVTVTLTGFSTKDQGDLLSLLVGPGGNNLDFFSLTGSNVSNAPSPFNLTFSDTASSRIAQGSSGNLSSAGTFQPSSYNTNITYPQCPPNASSCASPPVGPPLSSNPFTPTNKAATAGTAVLGNANEAGVFGGTSSSTYNGNGTWSLYLDDGGPTGGGEASFLTGGWCVSLTVNLPSVSVTKSHTATFTQGQQGVPFTVNITNNGPGTTGDPTAGSNPLTVTDTLNSAFSFASSAGIGWSCSATGQTVTCTNDSSVAQGSSYSPLTISVNVSPTASTTTPVPNQVSVSGGGAKNTTSNTDSVTILPAPVLSVQKSHTGNFTQGQTAQWSITVSNTAASSSLTSGTITVSDTLPTGYTLASFAGTGWSCSGTSTVTCTTTGGIVGGANSVITLTVDVPAASAVSVANSAKTWGGGDLTHTSLGTAAVSNTDTATVLQVPASMSINTGNNQSATIDTALAAALSVTLKDAGGVVIPSFNVTFTATTGGNGQSGIFSNSTNTIQVATNGSGIASPGTFTANSKVGSYSVAATAGSASATFNLTNTAGAPAHIALTGGNGQSAIIGTAFTNPLIVTVTDTGGNLVPSATVTFTAPAGTTASLVFPNSSTTISEPTNANGQANSGTMTANSKGGSYSVTATAGSASATFNLTNTPGPPTNIALISGSGQSAAIRTGFANPLIAIVTDIGGNAVSGVTVTFTAPAGLTPSLTFSNASSTITEPTNAFGQASSGAMTANGIPGGPYNVQASVGSLAVNFQLTNLGKSLTTFASLTTTAATIDVFGFGFTAPSGQLAFTDITTSTPVVAPVTLNTATATTALTPQTTTSTGTNTLPCWTELADINGDGKLDLITSLFETDSVTVQLGNGDGTFQTATTILIGTDFGPAEVHAVSLRGNGTLDLIVGSFNLNQIAVLLGNGNGTFESPTFYTVGTSTNTPTSLTAGDFNHDGKIDVATANTFNNNVSILLGNGNGALTLQSSPIKVGRVPQAIRAGDFNGDGYSDLAVANYEDGTVSILLNNKNGTFATTTVGDGANSGPQALAITGSGISQRLAVANFKANTISVMQNNGSGVFTIQTTVPVGKGPDDVNFAELNGDGLPDIVVSNFTDGTVDLLLGGSSGFTRDSAGPFPVGKNPYSAAVGDLNQDGTPDLVVSNCFSNNTGVLLDGTQISVPYSGLSLSPTNLFNGSYTRDGASKYGSSTSANKAP